MYILNVTMYSLTCFNIQNFLFCSCPAAPIIQQNKAFSYFGLSMINITCLTPNLYPLNIDSPYSKQVLPFFCDSSINASVYIILCKMYLLQVFHMAVRNLFRPLNNRLRYIVLKYMLLQTLTLANLSQILQHTSPRQ